MLTQKTLFPEHLLNGSYKPLLAYRVNKTQTNANVTQIDTYERWEA